ncbi:MAG TPA: bifunctional glutamate N-acetyltransferase/amino-acid acetyltransferase ArgJ [Candidatus Methanofastidiosa archaeon]|nr:bifunctional glutamate N-acetyltransferase/amino-acid acetyltransferase ArgJ [Candidatus Methanofastidiosa archaeon]
MSGLEILKDKHIWEIEGFRANGAHTGLKYKRKDFTIICSDTVCEAAAVFTRNKLKAAPLIISKAHLENGRAQAVICNSGNANACTGKQGLLDAKNMAEITAREVGCDPEDVIVLSTGVIGVMLPMDEIERSIVKVASILGKEKGTEAAEGIMTTDKVPKELVVETEIGGKKVRIGAIAKGSGMIHPNMATMLSFIVTDASISHENLLKALRESVDQTYNMISVDGDTSTNDTVAILANGRAGNEPITEGTEEYDKFLEALNLLNGEIAKMIVADGEGATKVFEVEVRNAPTLQDARKMAKAIISSSLVKAAVHGGDPNWGRVMCAAGYAGTDIEISETSMLSLSSNGETILLFEDGMPTGYSEENAKELMSSKFIKFILDLKKGGHSTTAWGCDLSNEYVDINAHYRT